MVVPTADLDDVHEVGNLNERMLDVHGARETQDALV